MFFVVSTILIISTHFCLPAQACSGFTWPGDMKAGISLTFDDARISQVERGIPLFDKYGVKATFYVSPESMIKRLDEWKEAVKNGHEIGNHSVYHPCTGNFLWARDRALENYTLEQMRAELDSASRLIFSLLDVYPVSFAYPCGQTFVGRGVQTRSYVPVVAELFETGRGWLDEGPNDPLFCDMAQLTGMELDGKTFDQVLELIEMAKSRGQWLILAGHEIGDEGRQTSLMETIRQICIYASDPANGVWIDTVGNIAEYINNNR